jgi:hypothetical protein
MTIDGDNVGIGTTSPGAKLDVSGAGNFSGGTVVSGIDTDTGVGVAIAKGYFLKSNDGNYLRNIIGQASGGEIEIGQGATGLISDINFKPGSSGNINFYGSGSLDMRVTASGNVGIGTTGPQAKLEVQGSAPFIYITDDTETESGIVFRDLQAGLGQAAAIKFSSSDNKLRFYNNDTTAQRMVIDVSGNVGIGTDSPGYKLDVSGNGRFTSTVTASNFILSSDKTLKDNISDINTDHVDVKWKNFELKHEPGVKRAGVIAQELEKKHPEFVRTDKDGIKSVAYIDLLIAKIAELEARLEKAGL